MAEILLHNTLSGKKEPLKTRKAGEAGLYVCGITPYDESHIGHARCYVVFDVLKRALLKNNFKVRHIQNFTDVDDKIIERAQKMNVPSETYPKPFIDSFQRYMKLLNVLPADVYPLVTTHMEEIKTLIEKIISRGLAYVVEGDVYFSVAKFKGYGALSKRKLDELQAGARVDVDERKKDPLDFALWKKAKPGEPFWESPWGQGRPGWHIECSAMSMKYLGEEFDIHGGGLDLIFPHHENEIAQSVGGTGSKFAQVWVHNGFVTINKEKMSKSLGNFFTIKEVLAKYDPMVVRYFLLSVHYRSPLNFSDQDLNVAMTTWQDRICGAYRIASENDKGEKSPMLQEFYDAMNNDLNTAAALGVLNQTCSEIFAGKTIHSRALLDEMFDWLGLAISPEENWEPEILDLVKQREEARKTRNWTASDQARDALRKRGVVIEDTPAGPRLKRIEKVS